MKKKWLWLLTGILVIAAAACRAGEKSPDHTGEEETGDGKTGQDNPDSTKESERTLKYHSVDFQVPSIKED